MGRISKVVNVSHFGSMSVMSVILRMLPAPVLEQQASD